VGFPRRIALSVLVATGVACGARSELLDVAAQGEAPGMDAGMDGAPPFDASPDSSADSSPEDGPVDTAPPVEEFAIPCTCPTGEVCVDDGGLSSTCVPVPPPRAIAPLSTATVTSQRPRFHWALAPGDDGAQVDVCGDRACTQMVTVFTASGTSGAPPKPLTAGLYYWRLHGSYKGTVGTQTSVVWEFVVGARSAPVDTSWGSIVDYDGDGLADVVIGAPDLNSLTGAVYAYSGSTAGLSTSFVTLTNGSPPFPEFGTSVASAGDVNGDGFADVIIGSPSQNGGAAYVYAGGPGGLGTVLSTVQGPATGHDFGHGVSSAGDVNGDGYADVLVEGPAAGGSAGGANLYLGGPTGVSATPIPLTTSTLTPVASVGDVNGDGFGDIAVGDFWSNHDDGSLTLFLGAPSGPSAPTTIIGPIMYGGFGYAFTGADVNGDGYADLLVGAAGETPSLCVYLGSASGVPAMPSAIITPMTGTGELSYPASEFGHDLASADVNGDGYADVLLGHLAPGATSGTVYLYLGGPSGLSPMPTMFHLNSGGFGETVAGPGDVNGDGFADVVVGAPFASTGAGAVFLYLGGPGGLASMPTVSLMAPGTGPGTFGYSIAGTSQE
jgi:hypothetical protein